MDQQQIINTITQQLDGAAPASGAGFSVATGELTGYVRDTRRMADELHRLATRKINSVRTIADDSFGRIGRETGFAEALDHFAETLEHQVNGVARNADKLGDAVAKTARDYRRQDQEVAEELLDLLS